MSRQLQEAMNLAMEIVLKWLKKPEFQKDFICFYRAKRGDWIGRTRNTKTGKMQDRNESY